MVCSEDTSLIGTDLEDWTKRNSPHDGAARTGI